MEIKESSTIIEKGWPNVLGGKAIDPRTEPERCRGTIFDHHGKACSEDWDYGGNANPKEGLFVGRCEV